MAHFEVLLRHLPGETGKPQNNSVTEGDGQARICIRDVQNSKGVRCSFDRNTKSKTSTERTENRKKKYTMNNRKQQGRNQHDTLLWLNRTLQNTFCMMYDKNRYSFSNAYESCFSVMAICNCNKKQKSNYSRIRH